MAYAAPETRADPWLARAIDRYHELCGKPSLAGPHVVASFVSAQLAAGLTFGGTIQCRSLRPAFITRSSLAELTAAVDAFWAASRILEQRAITDDGLAAELGLSPQERALIAIDPGYDDGTVVSRLDTLGTDPLRIIEYNADSPAGMSYQAGQAKLVRALPVFEHFAREYRLEELHADVALRHTILSVWRDFAKRKGISRVLPAVAIVDLREGATSTEFELVARDFRNHGIETVIATPEDLSYENGELRALGCHVDLVYKRLLVADFLAHYDLNHPLIKAYADGAVCVASSFRCVIAHKKRALAVLQKRSAQLPQTMLDDVIAKTWPIEQWNPADLELARRNLVLKPNDAHGGDNVFVGMECDHEAWRAAVAKAAAGDYVVQEWVRPVKGPYPIFDPGFPEKGFQLETLIEDLNAYVFRGTLGGTLTRLSPTAVINVSRGGQAIPTFVIDPM